MFGVHVTLLDELLRVTNCPSEKAVVIIDKVQLVWTARKETARYVLCINNFVDISAIRLIILMHEPTILKR